MTTRNKKLPKASSATSPASAMAHGLNTQSQPSPTLAVLAPAERQFSVEYRRGILAEVDACQKFGQIEALLEREGLYYAHLVQWRLQLTTRGGRS